MMASYNVNFNSLPWESPAPGAKFKVFKQGNRRLRLLELTGEFVEKEWCEKGHTGIVLEGQLEVAFADKTVRFEKGEGIFIPAGEPSKHKARAVTRFVTLFLVEDI